MSKRSKNSKNRKLTPEEAVGQALDRAADDLDALLAKGDPAAMALVGRCGIGPDGPTPAIPEEN